MKAQIYNNQIVSFGNIEGTAEQGVYTLIGEMPANGEPTFEIIGDQVHITGAVPFEEEPLSDAVTLTAPNGTRYNLQVDNEGQLIVHTA
jgi:hypothetical protein